jgi:hypothetical protein
MDEPNGPPTKRHGNLRPLDSSGTPGRRWRCIDCGTEATGIPTGECTAPDQPPCKWCGRTPICAIDCEGVKAALGLAAEVIGPPDVIEQIYGGKP